MKVRVTFTVEVDDDFRRALRSYYGKDEKAGRQELKDHFECAATSMIGDILWEYKQVKGVKGEETL